MVLSDDEEIFTREWLMLRGGELSVDVKLFERAVYCLLLTGYLKNEGLDFLFKGGTSLILLLKDIRRLSIDVDIATGHSKDDIENVLNRIIVSSPFTHYKENIRKGPRHDKIPKVHYKIYYKSQIDDEYQHVLFDVVFQEPKYRDQEIVLSNQLFPIKTDIHLRVPTIASILGDKLVAFAPKTTGIKYGEGKELQRIKQLFDIGCLFMEMNDTDGLHDSFSKCIEQENNFFKEQFNIHNVADDIEDLALLINFIDIKGYEENDRTEEIRRGIISISSHLTHGGRYLHQQVKVDAARASFCVNLIDNLHKIPDINRIFHNVRDVAENDNSRLDDILSEVKFPTKLKFITRLRKAAPKAVIYWCGCMRWDIFQ